MAARIFGDPEPSPTTRGALEWLLVQMSATLKETPTLSTPMKEALQLWGTTALDALQRRPPDSPEETPVRIHSLLSQRDSVGRVEVMVGESLVQLAASQAISLAHEIIRASEAARADEALFKFAIERIGVNPEQAVLLVQESRQFRAASEALAWTEESEEPRP